MTDTRPMPEQFMGNPEPPVWATIERYAKQNDEFSAALLSIRARVEQLEANSKVDKALVPERFEIIPTDYALAYGALARRVAAIDAILRSDQWPEHCLKRLRVEADAAMTTIQQVETVRLTIPPQS